MNGLSSYSVAPALAFRQSDLARRGLRGRRSGKVVEDSAPVGGVWFEGENALTRLKNRAGNAIRRVYSAAFKQVLMWGSKVKMVFFLGVGLLAFLPLPQRLRSFVERVAVFPPGRVSDVPFFAAKPLEHKLNKFYFDMYQPVRGQVEPLRKLGLNFDPKQDHIKLRAWYIPAKPGMPTVLFHQQRSSSLSYLGSLLSSLSDDTHGYGVFAYDYPGCGKSEGEASEEAMYKAGVAASAYLKNLGVPYDEQVQMGYSLGNSIAAKVSRVLQEQGTRPNTLVLINSFPSLRKIIEYHRDRQMGFLGSYKHWLIGPNAMGRVNTRLNCEADINALDGVHTLFLQGERDTSMPLALVEAMRKKRPDYAQNTHMIALPNIGHQLSDRDYQTVVAAFCKHMQQHRHSALPQRDSCKSAKHA